MNERRHRELFAAPVDPKFLTAWRDFEDRYEPVLSDIFWEDIFGDDFSELSTAEPEQLSQKQELAIEGAIEFAHDQATQEWRDFQRDAGFDLRGIPPCHPRCFHESLRASGGGS